jgi:hypothetical protein
MPDRVEEMVVVQHPQRVDTGDLGVRALLPVDPPEIDAFVLKRVGEGVEVRGEEGAVGAVERDGLAGRGGSAVVQTRRVGRFHTSPRGFNWPGSRPDREVPGESTKAVEGQGKGSEGGVGRVHVESQIRG